MPLGATVLTMKGTLLAALLHLAYLLTATSSAATPHIVAEASVHKSDEHGEEDEARKALQSLGHTTLHGVLPELDTLAIRRAWERRCPSQPFMCSDLRDDPLVHALVHSPQLMHVASAALAMAAVPSSQRTNERDIVVRHDHYFLKTNATAGTEWHVDGENAVVTVWIPLQNMSNNSGCLCFADGSHDASRWTPELTQWATAQHLQWGMRTGSGAIDTPSSMQDAIREHFSVTCACDRERMRPGDISVHFGSTWHRSARNQAEARHVLSVEYTYAKAVPGPRADARHLAQRPAVISQNSGLPALERHRSLQSVSITSVAELEQAVSQGSATTIYLAAGTYQLSTELIISRNVSLMAPSKSSQATLQAATNSRVLRVSSGQTVTLQNLFIRGGRQPAATTGGGGIRNEGTLTLVDCTVHDNQCSNSGGRGDMGGAGIYNIGTLTMRDGAISHNIAHNNNQHDGGGLRNHGTAVLERVTVNNNAASNVGGILNSGSALTMIDCIVRRKCAYAMCTRAPVQRRVPNVVRIPLTLTAILSSLLPLPIRMHVAQHANVLSMCECRCARVPCSARATSKREESRTQQVAH